MAKISEELFIPTLNRIPVGVWYVSSTSVFSLAADKYGDKNEKNRRQ